MNLRRIKWLAILAPIGFIGVLEYSRYALAPMLGSWQEHLLMDGVVLLGALFFYGAVFTLVAQMHERLESQNRELVALRAAGLDITSELSLDAVLHKVVDQARQLIGTRYGALAVYGEDGEIRNFLTSGMGEEEIHRIGSLPIGRGLLGVVMREGQCLRIDDIRHDDRSCGFPAHHPPMRSLLAVPVVCRSPFRGNLYLSEKLDGGAFEADEEETLARFATQAGVAVDNAHLHAQVGSLAIAEERLRLAREMHDGQAQVLAYVNTKAQAVAELLRGDRSEEAREQLGELAAAAREVLADVREGILGLRAIVDAGHGLSDALNRHIASWQEQSGLAVELQIEDLPRFTTEVELQLLRIVQESLANVRKHAAAECAEVTVESHHGGVRIVVEDHGAGFDPASWRRSTSPRFGLATMRERAEAIGARLDIQSRPGAGTRIDLEYIPPSEAG